MIRNQARWENWEKRLIGKTRPDRVQNLRLLDAMYEEARTLGLFPPPDPLEGLEQKIQWIRILHVSKAA